MSLPPPLCTKFSALNMGRCGLCHSLPFKAEQQYGSTAKQKCSFLTPILGKFGRSTCFAQSSFLQCNVLYDLPSLRVLPASAALLLVNISRRPKPKVHTSQAQNTCQIAMKAVQNSCHVAMKAIQNSCHVAIKAVQNSCHVAMKAVQNSPITASGSV